MEHLQNINMLDAIFGGIILISFIIGLTRGLIVEIFSLVGWILSLWIASKFSPEAEPFIKKIFDSENVASILAFISVFILSLFVLGLVNMFVSYLLSSAKLTWINSLFGSVFGFARGVVVCAIILCIINMTKYKEEEWYKQSAMTPYLNRLINVGVDALADSKIKERIIEALRAPATDTNGPAEAPKYENPPQAVPEQVPADPAMAVQQEQPQQLGLENLGGQPMQQPAVQPEVVQPVAQPQVAQPQVAQPQVAQPQVAEPQPVQQPLNLESAPAAQ